MRFTKGTLLLTGFLVAGTAVLGACSNGTASPSITGSEAPAPGSQDGVRSISDTDYEQIALAVDTSQIKLATIAKQPPRQASAEVDAIATQALETLAPEALQLRQNLVKAGDAATSHNHKAAIEGAAFTKLESLTGAAFDSAWARAMYVLNEQVIAAAATEMNYGEDKATRALARAKIDYASAQNGRLRPIAGTS